MGAKSEINQIGSGLSGIGEGLSDLKDRFTGMFDPAQKEARATVKAAEAEGRATVAAARGEVAAAQAKATADALKTQAKATVEAIEAQAAKSAEAIKSGKGIAQQAVASEAKAWTFGRVASKPFRVAGNILAAPLKWSAKFGVGTVDTVAGVALKPVKLAANGVGGAFKSRPGIALAVTAGAAAVAAGSWFAKRGSQNLQAQSDAIQQMQMAQAMPQGMYMNNPEASQAFVDARIAADRANGVGPASQVDSLAARKPIDQPESASIAAL